MTPAAGDGTCTDVCDGPQNTFQSSLIEVAKPWTAHQTNNIFRHSSHLYFYLAWNRQVFCLLPYQSRFHRPPRPQRPCLRQLKIDETEWIWKKRIRRAQSWNPDDVLPFSHLTSPSVTDSANAGVFTVITSFPEIQSQYILHYMLIALWPVM